MPDPTPAPVPPIPLALGALIAGGRAQRLGGLPKGLVRDAAGETLLARAHAVLAATCQRVVLVADPAGPYAGFARQHGLAVVPDPRPGLGAPGGVLGALQHAAQLGLDPAEPEAWVAVLPCDLAAPDADLLRALVPHRRPPATLWTAGGAPQPLVALWHLHAGPHLAARLGLPPGARAPSLWQLCAELGAHAVPLESHRPDLLPALADIDTPADLAAAGLRLPA